MADDSKVVQEEFLLYAVNDSKGQCSSFVKAPKALPCNEGGCSTSASVANILMADVSGSMCGAWQDVVQGWNDSIKDKLLGRTKIYVFSDSVKFIRSGNNLTQNDFTGSGTNLTAALKKIREEVEMFSEDYINVFIITDGHHGYGDPHPDIEISMMNPPPQKTINVYLLGIGTGFPVSYSIDIRSRLHNGSANLPSLYWAKEYSEIQLQQMSIGMDLTSGYAKLTLNHEGYILPGLDKTMSIHLGEWLYFAESPELLTDLMVTINDQEERKVYKEILDMNASLLLDQVFPQWNSVLIKQHRKKLHVPMEAFDMMDSMFQESLKHLKSSFTDNESIKSRLQKKCLKTFEIKYATLMNRSKTVITVEGKYQNEMELAENILRSTVTDRKFDTKVLKIRGHGLDEYAKDVAAFRILYDSIKPNIMALAAPNTDDCCRITINSTLKDLQDPDFLMLLEEEKYDLLKNFTMTGIPVYAPIRDSSQINPWTIGISHILVSPYTILSQGAIEEYAGMSSDVGSLGFVDKDILLQADDEKSRFNLIIPVVPTYAATTLKPLVRSNLYAMMTTFCVLKNPHIIDHYAHIAALGCAWVKTISDFPSGNRPDFVTNRITNLTATTELYMDRPGIVHYLNVLSNNPKQALMTESTDQFEGQTVKCESLIKPLFFLGMCKEKFTMSQVREILHLVLAEFIGRCLSSYKPDCPDAMPFTDFFAAQLSTSNMKKREEWLENKSQTIVEGFKSIHGNLVEEFYSLDKLQACIKKYITFQMASLGDNLTKNVDLKVNMEKVKHLVNRGSCGDVRLNTFQSWALEMNMPEEEIKAAYDPSEIFVHVCEALTFHSSRERLGREPNTYAQCFEIVRTNVTKENEKSLIASLTKKIESIALTEWKESYMTIHRTFVLPLLPQEIVAQAQARGIEVTEETFKQVYRYGTDSRLLHNACQIPDCPFYLKPSKNFNQHISVERTNEDFPHSLHVVSHKMHSEGVDKVVEEISLGTHTGRQGRRKPPPPRPLSLESIYPQIQDLVEMYKKIS